MSAPQDITAQNGDPNAYLGPGLLEAVWRFRWLVAAMTVIAALAGYGASYLQPTLYEGKASLLLRDPRNSGVFRDVDRISLDPSRYVRNQAQFVSSRAVAVLAADILDGALTSDEILETVKAKASIDLDLIEIRATAPTALEAAELANAVAQAYQDRVTQEVAANAEASIQELESSKRGLQERIDSAEQGLAANPGDSALRAERDASVAQLISIEARANQIAVDASLYGSGVELFEEAEIPEAPAQPKPLRNAAVAAVLGLMAAAALAWWRAERLDNAEDRHAPARILGAPLLGEIPDFASAGVTGNTPTQSAPHSGVAEAYQFVIASLEFAMREAGATSVIITSAGPSDGKSVTALNLAIAALQDGRKVLLVDADERMRQLTRDSGVNPTPGLTDVGDERIPYEGCQSTWRLSERVQIPFLSAGTPLTDPASYFRGPGFRRAMTRVRAQADLVLIDSPPLLAVADASAIAGQVDAVLVVVNHGTSLKLLAEVRHRLDFIGTPLIGYVFNRAPATSRGYGYYRYGYTYGRNPETGNGGSPAPKRLGRRTPQPVPPAHD